MMNFRIATLVAAACMLSGCYNRSYDESERTNPTNQTDQYSVRCLDGVKYWHRKAGHSQQLAPVIDKDTLAFVRC